jgi:GT2 family glycosyltransferase
MSKNAPLIHVIVLNWNGREDTLECLKSLEGLDHPRFCVVVVDNGSVDGSVAAIREKYPDVAVLETGANLGYAGGNNVGIQWSLSHGADFILLLNNDTVVAPNLLSALSRAAELLPEGSIIGAAISFFDRPDVLWFGGASWSTEKLGFRTTCRGRALSDLPEEPFESDYITGCALFAPVSTFKATGLLDDNFFLTYEETDWCYRARTIGFRCFVTREARLWHKVSASFGGAGSPLVRYFMVRNRLLWGRRHLHGRQRRLLHQESWRILLRSVTVRVSLTEGDVSLAKRMIWTAASWFRGLRKNLNDPLIRAGLFGLRDYYLRRFGDCPAAVRELCAK